MPTYRQIKQQIAELEKKADVARREEAAGAIASIRSQIAKYELKPSDIFESSVLAIGAPAMEVRTKPQAKLVKAPTPPKYRDPQSGNTWTGRGKPPRWLAEATKRGKRDEFLIEKASVAVPAVDKAMAKKAPTASAKKPTASVPKKVAVAKKSKSTSSTKPKPAKKAAVKKTQQKEVPAAAPIEPGLSAQIARDSAETASTT